MKPKFKIDDVLVYERGDYTVIFKVVYIFVNKEKKLIEYVAANGSTLLESTLKKYEDA